MNIGSWVVASFVFVLSSAPFGAHAIPFTYSFGMPAFSGGPHAGQTSILDVTVDNGSADPFNETYLNTQVVALSVTVGGSTFSSSGPLRYLGSTVYITTDTLGAPTLDLSADIDTYAFFNSNGNFIQLGTRDDSGPTQYAVLIPGDAGHSSNSSDIVVAGASIAVPEAGPLSLIGTALLLFGLSRYLSVLSLIAAQVGAPVGSDPIGKPRLLSLQARFPPAPRRASHSDGHR